MQISDLNSNLIQALGGKQASQTKAEDKNSEFADVLRDTVQGVDEFMGADEYPETVVAEYHREVADVGAKKN